MVENSDFGSTGIVLCSENIGVDQLRGYCAADLSLFLIICKSRIFPDEAQIMTKMLGMILHPVTL